MTPFFFYGIMIVRQSFFSFRIFTITSGYEIVFWEDTWIGNAPLSFQFPSLYHIVGHEFATIKKVLGTHPPDPPDAN